MRTYHVNLLKKFVRREVVKQGDDGRKGDSHGQNDDINQGNDKEEEKDQREIEAGGIWQRNSNLLDIVGGCSDRV